jgi:hypothetical protein
LRQKLALRVFFLDGAERGRRREHGGAAVLGDHAPERAGIRRADRLALVEDRRAAVDERRIDDVAVTDHPADIGSRPIHLARIDAVEILHRPFERDHVAAIVTHHALRAPRRSRGVEDVERIGRLDRHAIVDRAGVDERVIAHLGPVVVAAGDQRRFRLRTLQDEAGVGLVLRERDRLVEQWLVGDDAAGLEAAACREDHLRLGVVDAGGEFARGEAAEHDRMNRADARAGEHADRCLRHHRHVEDDAVAFADAEIAQHGGEHLRLGHQAVIGDGALHPGERRIVDDRGLLAAPGVDVAVDRIEAGVADAADEPAAVNSRRRVENGFGLFEPVDSCGRFGPEALRVALPAGVDLVVAARAGVHGAFSKVYTLPQTRAAKWRRSVG